MKYIIIIIILIIILLNINLFEKYTNNKIINFIHIPKNAGTSIKELCNDKLKYNGHGTNVFNPTLNNQLVILRNPVDRFVSAVKYCLENRINYSKSKKYKPGSVLLENNIDTPNKWITVWKNKNHPYHDILMDELYNNNNKKVNNKIIKYKWIYTPQETWFNKPKYILIMDNLDEELEYICNTLNMPYNLKKKNKTTNKENNISKENLEWINIFYKDDWILYNKYKNISFKNRINLTF
jgi:hypothetical protein